MICPTIVASTIVLASCAYATDPTESNVRTFRVGHGTGYGNFCVGPFDDLPEEIVVVFEERPPTVNFSMWNHGVSLKWQGDYTMLYERTRARPLREKLVSEEELDRLGNTKVRRKTSNLPRRKRVRNRCSGGREFREFPGKHAQLFLDAGRSQCPPSLRLECRSACGQCPVDRLQQALLVAREGAG